MQVRHHLRDEKVRELFWCERPKLAYLNFGSLKIWIWLWVWGLGLDLCMHETAAGMNHELDWGTCGAARGHRDWGCKDSRFSWHVGPHGGSLLSPAGSPNKALPPQFTSPNEKVVYELEAGKVQHSQPASGTGRPTRLSPSTASLVLSLTEHTSCTGCLVDSVRCQFLMPE